MQTAQPANIIALKLYEYYCNKSPAFKARVKSCFYFADASATVPPASDFNLVGTKVFYSPVERLISADFQQDLNQNNWSMYNPKVVFTEKTDSTNPTAYDASIVMRIISIEPTAVTAVVLRNKYGSSLERIKIPV